MFGVLRPKIFRTRSAERDAQTDLRRLNELKTLIDRLDADISREREGVNGRQEECFNSLGFLMGNEAVRDVKEIEENEALLAQLESEHMRAKLRVAALDDQLGIIKRIQEVVGEWRH